MPLDGTARHAQFQRHLIVVQPTELVEQKGFSHCRFEAIEQLRQEIIDGETVIESENAPS